jgi:hypothetical protein
MGGGKQKARIKQGWHISTVKVKTIKSQNRTRESFRVKGLTGFCSGSSTPPCEGKNQIEIEKDRSGNRT